MGRHSAPEPPQGHASVVRMTPARHARSRMSADDTVPVDLTATGGFVDDLTLITADDQLLDCIAAGQGDVFVMPQHFSSGFPAGSLAPLLATWRSEIVDPQWPSLPTPEQVREAVRAERRPAVKRTRRALKPMLGVAMTISALLFSSAAVGAQSAKPGDALWPLTQVLYTERADSYAAGEAAKGSLATADAALSSGNPTSARLALTSAQREMDKVKLSEVKAPLEAVYATLMSKASIAAVTESEQSAAKVALESASAATTDRAGLKPVTSRPSTQTTKPTGTSPVRSSVPGAPVTVGSTSTAPTTGVTAPVTTPSNPTDPAATPTTAPSTPVTSDPSASATPTVPVTTDPVTTDPGTTGPITTDPATTDPSSAPGTDPATTQASTTSELPTPTPTDPGTTDPGPNAVSIAPAAVASQ